MDYSKIKAPFFSREDITRKAETFRDKYWRGKKSPINIMEILEFGLGIRVIPVRGLEMPCSTSALLTASWDCLYIDYDQYMDERYDKRTNFSVAHEIGHMVLHKELYESLKIKKLEDFYEYFENFPAEQYKYLEYHANLFAGKVLVPKDELEKELTKYLAWAKKGKISAVEVSDKLSEKFQVSTKTIFYRVTGEKIEVSEDVLEGFG